LLASLAHEASGGANNASCNAIMGNTFAAYRKHHLALGELDKRIT
jgi:hypothetical protein